MIRTVTATRYLTPLRALRKGEMFGVFFGLSLNPPQPPFGKGGRYSEAIFG